MLKRVRGSAFRCSNAYGLNEDGAVLVRPDGHVAWRSATGPGAGALLRDAVERILHRERE